MSEQPIPTLAEFLRAPLAEVASVAPATLVYGAGGTRRRAVFEGIEPWSEAYVQWGRTGAFECTNLIFQHGVQNVIATLLTPDNFKEVSQYQDQLIDRAIWAVAGPEALADYARYGWRVRLIGAGNIPTMASTVELLQKETPTEAAHTLYWHIATGLDDQWAQLLAAAAQTGASSRTALMRALYGEVIPPIGLYLGFGKPTILPEIIPPLLMDQIQCYWSQQPGYTLTAAQLRTVFYDYAYLRPTWRAAKLERAHAALDHRAAWEAGPLLGLGMRLGPFWYPAPMTSPAWNDEG